MRRALVVGINDYKTAPLKGCVNDANAVASVLATHGDGSPNFDVVLQTSPSQTITKENLSASIDKLFGSACDVALLYFSGHGTLTDTGGHIVTPDAKKYSEGVPMDHILTWANQSPVHDKIIVFDCCHSGAFGAPAVAANSHAQLAEGLTVLMASRADESALEVNGCGVFTSLLVDALRGGAADLRGHVTPGSVYAYVDQALGSWDQRPIFRTNVSRFTSLRSVPPKVPATVLRKLTDYFVDAQAEHQLAPEYEDTNTPHDKTKVAIFKDLQKMQSVGLVVPVDEEYMYFAAMNSKSCRLTALGYHYWRLARDHRI